MSMHRFYAIEFFLSSINSIYRHFTKHFEDEKLMQKFSSIKTDKSPIFKNDTGSLSKMELIFFNLYSTFIYKHSEANYANMFITTA